MKIISFPATAKHIFFIALSFILIVLSNPVKAQNQSENNEENAETDRPGSRRKMKKKVFRYNHVISVYPALAVINYMALGYEFKTGAKGVFKTMAGYAQTEGGTFTATSGDETVTKYSAYKVEMQFKYFITKKGEVFNGVYFGPFAQYKACNFNYDWYGYDPLTGLYGTINHKGNASAIHIGFILGYHVRLSENFTLDGYAGEGLMSAAGKYNIGSRLFDTYTNSIRLKVGLSLGFGL